MCSPQLHLSIIAAGFRATLSAANGVTTRREKVAPPARTGGATFMSALFVHGSGWSAGPDVDGDKSDVGSSVPG
jgi:hypothetical protein